VLATASVVFVTSVWIIALILANEPIEYSDDPFEVSETAVSSFAAGVWLPWLLGGALAVYAIASLISGGRWHFAIR
jgi:hypothetical protein